MGDEDEDLARDLAAAQRGDPQAFDRIYYQFANPLYRYLYARCGDPTLAEELSGDLWLRVVENLKKFQIPQHGAARAFRTWLYRIAHNLAIDALRRGNRTAPFDQDYIDDLPLPDEQVIALDEQRLLREAFEALTPEQREVVLLRFFEERSNAEVAALTGRSEGAVKVMQHRALKALARLLGIERRGEHSARGEGSAHE